MVDAARPEPRLRQRKALVQPAEQVADRDPHAVELDLGVPAVRLVGVAEDGRGPHDVHARRVHRHQDHAVPAVPFAQILLSRLPSRRYAAVPEKVVTNTQSRQTAGAEKTAAE